MKKILILSLLMVFSFNAFAQHCRNEEKIVTTRLSLLTGSAAIADHYFSNQQYLGSVLGASVSFGSFYTKVDNLSWNLSASYLGADGKKASAPTNAAGSSSLGVYDFEIDYGTAYNWNPAKNLYLRAGGKFNINAGAFYAPKSINNVLEFIMQPQLQAAAGIKYGWDINKVKLSLFADFDMPFMGFALVGSKYEGTKEVASILPNGLNKPTLNHFKFTSFHNLQGFDLNVGLDVQFRNFSLLGSIQSNCKWWNAYGVQCYKRYVLFNLGIAVDLVSRPRSATNNRYF